MEAAIKCVQTEFVSENKAADLHGVPQTTLKDRLSGRLLHGTKSGPKPYLTENEKADLITHLVKAAKISFGKTRRGVMSIVETYMKQKGTLRSSGISDGW